MPKFMEIWTPGNTANSGQFHTTFISLVKVPWCLENQWCQINRWLLLHVTKFMPCVSAIIKPWHHVFRVRPWIHDSWCTTVRWREACSAWWFPDPSCTQACGQFKPWDMVAWASSCLEFPNPDEHRSSMFCCCPCLHIPKAILNWESFHTKERHIPWASSMTGMSAIATGHAGAAYGHSQFLVMCAHCDITNNTFLIGQTA
jgi:hypothetical protein